MRLLTQLYSALVMVGAFAVHTATADTPQLPAFAEILTPKLDIDGTLRVRVDHLSDLSAGDAQKIRLILNDRAFPDVVPAIRTNDVLSFSLGDLQAEQNGNWQRLLASPPMLGAKILKVALSGPDGIDISESAALTTDQFTLQIFSPARMLIACSLAILILLIFFYFTSKTKILRDNYAAGSAVSAEALKNPQWSLGRCQMAFWFIAITILFLMLWTVTGSYNGIITAQSLALIGISGSSAVGAAAIDIARPTDFTGAVGVSQGFFVDILQDSTGWAFHRLQMFIWTLILGGIAVWSAWTSLTLPNFDENLLILMGVSSGLYLGFKFPEQGS